MQLGKNDEDSLGPYKDDQSEEESLDQNSFATINKTHKIIKDDDQLDQNKHKILTTFVALVCLVLFLIVERVIYQFMVNYEDDLMMYLQQSFGFVGTKQTDRGVESIFKSNFLFDIAGYIHENPINLMVFTNFFISIYVAVDALVAVKIMYTTYSGYFLVAFFQLIYANPRPFWTNEDLYTSVCLQSYCNPSSFVSQITFAIFYSFYCYEIKMHTRSSNSKPQFFKQKIFWFRVTCFLIIVIYSFILFIMALQYIINTILGFLYALIFYMVAVQFETQINNLLKHATIMNIDSKRYVFYWVYILIVAEVLMVVVVNSEKELLDIEWTQNYILCLSRLDSNKSNYPVHTLMGPTFTFDKTCVVFSLIGALFGVSHCFRHIRSLEWYKGSLHKRIARVIVANLFTIPFWFLGVYLQDISNIQQVYKWGLSLFILESIMQFCQYFFLFGVLPLRVFKVLKLLSTGTASYVVVNFDD